MQEQTMESTFERVCSADDEEVKPINPRRASLRIVDTNNADANSTTANSNDDGSYAACGSSSTELWTNKEIINKWRAVTGFSLPPQLEPFYWNLMFLPVEWQAENQWTRHTESV